MTTPDRLHYLKLPKAVGGRAEMVRMCYALADKPYVDVLHAPGPEAQAAVTGKNPFKQFPFVETPSGRVLYQSLAIMQHVGHGTTAWPADPALLTDALAVGLGGYDLYHHFGSFPAGDLPAKARFEERRAPKAFQALDEIYATRAFAIGDVPTFADCIVHEAVVWCVRRNDVCKALLEQSPSLAAFLKRFQAVPAIHAFMEKQAARRAVDDAV